MVRKKLIFEDDIRRCIDLGDYDRCFREFLEFFSGHKWIYAIGKFGNFSSPGISDIDGFIVAKEGYIRKVLQFYYQWIETKEVNRYFFYHPPVIVTRKMLPHINYIHSLNSLKLIHVNHNITITPEIDSEYLYFLNIAWTTYLIPIAIRLCFLSDKISLRSFLLVLGNMHESCDNLEIIFNETVRSKKRGIHLRTQILMNRTHYQQEIENEFYDTMDRIFRLLSEIAKKQPTSENHKSKICISKNVFVTKSSRNCLKKKGENLFGIYLNAELYDQIFNPKAGAALAYHHHLLTLYMMYRKEKVGFPIPSPFNYPIYKSKLYLMMLNLFFMLNQINRSTVR